MGVFGRLFELDYFMILGGGRPNTNRKKPHRLPPLHGFFCAQTFTQESLRSVLGSVLGTKKAGTYVLASFCWCCRGGRIRTCDLLLPKQAR